MLPPNKKLHNNVKPKACHILIFVNPNIDGINKFHKNHTGAAKIIQPKITNNVPKNNAANPNVNCVNLSIPIN